jgi:hypothetical protein
MREDEKEVRDVEKRDHPGAHHEPVLSVSHAQGKSEAHPEAHSAAFVSIPRRFYSIV